MGFFTRLKERRLFQIVAAYLAAGWVVLQVPDQLADREVLPNIAYTVALAWYIAGFFVALMIGWYHGEKGKQRAPVAELLGMVVIAGAVVAFTGVSVWGHVSVGRAVAAAEASALQLSRIAVPYFQDFTPDGELRHIADGLTESLIDELSGLGELDVLSRNAVAPYREERPSLDSIGRALLAGTLVDGSVDRAGDRIRVVVRLVDGQSGVQFSRAGLDMPLVELLEARQAVVEETANQLRALLGSEVRLRSSRRATSKLAAWTLYQRAEKVRKDAEAAVYEGDPERVAGLFETSDSLLIQAQLVDSTWVDPPVLWAWNAYRRSRMGADLDEAVHWIDVGLDRVEHALAVDPNCARALEVRGTLRYWHWLLGVIPDRERSDALFRDARADLERAVDLDEHLASAHASLAHLYLNAPDVPAAVLAGRKAYQEDAYLENADLVVWRILAAHRNLGQDQEVARWCEIGRDRFPENYRFVACELLCMAAAANEPDVPRAWTLLARLDSLAPPHQAEWEHIRGEMAVGAILARAGLPDSAAAVMERAHARIVPEVNPAQELFLIEAEMRTVLGQRDRAIDLLKLYAAANPGTSFEEEDGWWRTLRSHPRWRELAAGS